jgi:UDP-N-acetylmuramoyl-L-alanyl-D-glutamate--2,6-diaminopimelate ligase
VGPVGIRQLIGDDARAVSVPDVPVSGIAYRSGAVAAGDAFFCIAGFKHDGHDFAADAVASGAAALVVERELPVNAPQFVVSDTRSALSTAAAEFFGHPSDSVRVAGITGTNGKTTTAYLLDSILRSAGMTTGLIGTVETRIGGERVRSERTTPEGADLHELLARMREAGVDACSMEVSSHAIDLHRVDGVHFAVAAFTNLTQDHLDYHHTLEEYYSVKRRLFTEFEVDRAVLNLDDPCGADLLQQHPDAITVARGGGAEVTSRQELLGAKGSEFLLVTPSGEARVSLPLAGGYNVSNALVAAACALALGVEMTDIVTGLEHAPQVPGRLERIECGQPFEVIVDYAHTPDSLEKAVAAVRAVTPGRLITVFGCGGDRDPEKRPAMGAAAAEAGSDHVIITSDNPRSEDPVGIILQIEDGLAASGVAYETVIDRREAIERAVSMADAGDTVLLAGKGHEDYQIFSDRTIHFDDREVAREVIGGC